MDADAILHELTHAEGLPKATLAAASEQRAEMAPLFLDAIDSYLAATASGRAEPTPLFFIFHLFGEWREKSAYGRLASLLRFPPDEVDGFLGDGITSTAHRVMAGVFDGDPQPLHDIILDPDADEFVRSAMCETLAVLVLRGELDKAEAGRFLRDAFAGIEPQAQNFVWQGWQSAIAMLGLSEMKTLVKTAFERGFIDRQWLGFEHFERDLTHGIEHPGEPVRPGDDLLTPFGNVIEELSDWYGFSEERRKDRAKRQDDAWFDRDRAGLSLDGPYRNTLKGVGRNDPCPCGSGKKFKKCCLA
jgi:hypothetical protein